MIVFSPTSCSGGMTLPPGRNVICGFRDRRSCLGIRIANDLIASRRVSVEPPKGYTIHISEVILHCGMVFARCGYSRIGAGTASSEASAYTSNRREVAVDWVHRTQYKSIIKKLRIETQGSAGTTPAQLEQLEKQSSIAINVDIGKVEV
jgi:hypothetical protein